MASLAVGTIYAVCMLAVGATAVAAVSAGLALAAIVLMVSAIFTCCWCCCRSGSRSVTTVSEEFGTPFEPRSTLTRNHFLATQGRRVAQPPASMAFPLGTSDASRSDYVGYFHSETQGGLNHVPAVCLTELWRSRVPATPTTYDPRFTASSQANVTVKSSEPPTEYHRR